MNKVVLAAAAVVFSFSAVVEISIAATPPVFMDAEPAAGGDENLMADVMPAEPAPQQQQVQITEPQYFSAGEKQAETLPASTEASDDNGVKIIKPKMHQVTSLQKCLDQLSPEDAAEVKLNAVRPYQECIGRLAEKAQARRTKKAKDKEELAAEPEAENARNFSRIEEPGGNSNSGATEGHWSSKAYRKQATESAPPESAEDMVDEERPAKRRKSAEKKGFFSWRPEIKADNAPRKFNN